VSKRRVYFDSFNQAEDIGCWAEGLEEVQRDEIEESGDEFEAEADHYAACASDVFGHLRQDDYGIWYVETDEHIADTLAHIKESVFAVNEEV
jgi:hypothetical protein